MIAGFRTQCLPLMNLISRLIQLVVATVTLNWGEIIRLHCTYQPGTYTNLIHIPYQVNRSISNWERFWTKSCLKSAIGVSDLEWEHNSAVFDGVCVCVCVCVMRVLDSVCVCVSVCTLNVSSYVCTCCWITVSSASPSEIYPLQYTHNVLRVYVCVLR